jgi:ferredoxin
MRNIWGAFVCDCRGTLPVEAERLGQPAPLTFVARNPEAGAHEFAVQARAQGVDRVVASCCMGTAALRDALEVVRVRCPVVEVDLRRQCFLAHPDPAQAHGKAARMLRGAMAAYEEQGDIPEHHLAIGRRVVLALDDPAALPLAARMQDHAQLTLLVPVAPESLAGAAEHRMLWGRLMSLHGRLGEFKLQVVEITGNGRREESVRTLVCDQMIWASRSTPLPVKRRTGVHVVTEFTEQEFERVAGDVAELTGEFLKPQAVLYNTEICAGGAAQREACGRCIPACPYNLVSRDPENPLRVRVDHLACEGCGACVAACPTGALRYSDPGAESVANTIAGMLGPTFSEAAPPHLVVFHCSERGKRAIEGTESSSYTYTAQALPIEIPCLRYASASTLLAAFRMGAAGVALLGCGECPHGEREGFLRTLELVQDILAAFGIGAERLRLIAIPGEDHAVGLRALDAMAAALSPSTIRFPGKRFHAAGPREALADAVETFMTQLGTEPGAVPIAADQPFAMIAVRAEGCTLCRSCVNVCPTHAFRFDEAQQTLTFRHISCIACGLCEQVCPESVITLTRTLELNRAALEDMPKVRDEAIACIKCGKTYINRKALEAVRAKLAAIPALGSVYAGERKDLLRMCPDCRAIAAMGEVSRGWQP